jgi:hypothetical protein
VSSVEDSIAEFTPTGIFIQMHDLPAGVSDLSGIALDCASGEAWVSNTSGVVYHLGNFPCGTTGINEAGQDFSIGTIHPNPYSSETQFSINIKQRDEIKIAITDLSGRVVMYIYKGIVDAGARDFLIPQLPEGIYLVKASSNSYSSCKRIVSIH